jgi:hypothetical protein
VRPFCACREAMRRAAGVCAVCAVDRWMPGRMQHRAMTDGGRMVLHDAARIISRS